MGEPNATGRGTLRIYLGAAPGVGKTFALLGEGRRRLDRGTDVVVGFVEPHGRARTAEQIGNLPVVPRQTVGQPGSLVEEMDVDAVLRAGRGGGRPEVVLVDELAHTNGPGSRHRKRWQDVDALLTAGIHVISTVDIAHLESVNDVVEGITGVRPPETVPDSVVRAADQIELVDMTPEALQRRLAHGNIYAAEEVDAALANYFRLGNLAALRELALLWVADRVDESLEDYRSGHGITAHWETRERVVVALTGSPRGEHLIRRAARIAQRAHGELLGVHIHSDREPAGSAEVLDRHRRLLSELGGQYREVTGGDVAEALIDFARAENATQIVMGASRRSRWQELVHGSVINRGTRLAGPIDVHVISGTEEEGDRPRLPAPKRVLSPVSARRQAWGWTLVAAGLPLLTALLANLRPHVGLESVLLLFLVLAMTVALVGGVLPALAAVVGGFLLANWFFTPPFHEITISDAEHLLALLVYLLAAGVVAVMVDRVARSRLQAVRARAEAEAMAALAGSLAEEEAFPAVVSQLRTTFGMQSAALYRRNGDGWHTEAAAGDPVGSGPEGSDVVRELEAGLVLAMTGTRLAAEDERVLSALLAQLANAVETKRLRGAADQAGALARANDLRTALLQAVSHDLRTPLASIKASISSVRQTDVAWSPEDMAEFHTTIEEETDRLASLVTNLLDMSRIQAGALDVDIRPVGLADVTYSALASLGDLGRHVVPEVDEDLPLVAADPVLLERAVANLVKNAVAASIILDIAGAKNGSPVRVEAGAVGDRVDLRVIDRGPGISPAHRDRVFEPFSRLVDQGTGVGLGLAIARGFVASMGGDLTIEDTPGGGVTMVISLPVAAS